MSKKHIFLSIFSKIAIFACVFCALFVSSVFATLPSGYTELEYIESTGTQYIDTGIKGNQDTRTDLDFQLTQANVGTQWIYGARTSASSNQYMFLVGSNRHFASPFAGLSGDTSFRIDRTVVDNDTSRHLYIKQFKDENNNGTFDGNIVTSVASKGDFITPDNILLFSAYDSPSHVGVPGASMKCYNFRIYESGVMLSGDFVPAKRDSDNEIGMYDTVTNTFFTNQGTGSFIAGPVVEIKIATTKMVDDEFAAAEAKLATTVQTIESVVSRTIAQTGQIQILQDTKQTRPDESCPVNMKCLLVQDEDGTPHWYPIIEP